MPDPYPITEDKPKAVPWWAVTLRLLVLAFVIALFLAVSNCGTIALWVIAGRVG